MAGAASPKMEKPPSSQDGGPVLQELGMRPTVTSPSLAAADGLLITKVAILAAPLLGAVIALWRVRVSAEGAEPMCALSRRQSWLGEERNPARLEASPSLRLDALSR